MIALMKAATIPSTPAPNPKILAKPPLTWGDSDNNTPTTPQIMAIIASMKPQSALVIKLKMAAMTAMMDGMLNSACFAPCVAIIKNTPGN
jgi:hypothetical protein